MYRGAVCFHSGGILPQNAHIHLRSEKKGHLTLGAVSCIPLTITNIISNTQNARGNFADPSRRKMKN